MGIEVEIAVQDVDGVRVAREGGADRVELCSALALGGLTPSPGLIAGAVEAAGEMGVHVLVRPRPGDFEYAAAEVDVILRDVAAAREAGAAGVVVGGTRGGQVDTDLVRAVRGAAGPLAVTFHRAFDTLADRRGALDELAAAGAARVLTSGGADRAVDALAELVALVVHAAGRVEVMAGAGITADNALRVAATGVTALHASARRTLAAAPGVSLGVLARAGEPVREVTDPTAVRALVRLVKPIQS